MQHPGVARRTEDTAKRRRETGPTRGLTCLEHMSQHVAAMDAMRAAWAGAQQARRMNRVECRRTRERQVDRRPRSDMLRARTLYGGARSSVPGRSDAPSLSLSAMVGCGLLGDGGEAHGAETRRASRRRLLTPRSAKHATRPRRTARLRWQRQRRGAASSSLAAAAGLLHAGAACCARAPPSRAGSADAPSAARAGTGAVCCMRRRGAGAAAL